MTDQERIIVTCIQERLDNSVLTVRVHGKVVGRVVHDGKDRWVVHPPEPPLPPVFPSLSAAVDALVATELGRG